MPTGRIETRRSVYPSPENRERGHAGRPRIHSSISSRNHRQLAESLASAEAATTIAAIAPERLRQLPDQRLSLGVEWNDKWSDAFVYSLQALVGQDLELLKIHWNERKG
jgi:hypothetical protein